MLCDTEKAILKKIKHEYEILKLKNDYERAFVRAVITGDYKGAIEIIEKYKVDPWDGFDKDDRTGGYIFIKKLIKDIDYFDYIYKFAGVTERFKLSLNNFKVLLKFTQIMEHDKLNIPDKYFEEKIALEKFSDSSNLVNLDEYFYLHRVRSANCQSNLSM